MGRIDFTRIKRNLKIAAFKVKKHSPEILVVAGCTGAVVGAVMACKETLELEDTLDNVKNRIEEAKTIVDEDGEVSKKELTVAYAKGAGDIIKLYAPSVTVGALSIGMIFSSNNIMKKRNAAAAAAYATLDSMFKRYRENVVAKYGEKVDDEMRFGARQETIEEVVTDDKGKSKVVKKKVTVIDNNPSDFAKWFDESCPSWDHDAEYNLMFIQGVERMCNNKLIADGFIFLNDVYTALGLPRTSAGQYAGWVYDPDNPVGDNKINFKIFENVERKRAFVNGYEPCILLDFNVDGDIMNDERLKMYLKDI